jgi:hypothetical protein
MPKWLLPLGDEYHFNKKHDGWLVWILRKNTQAEFFVMRAARWSAVKKDFAERHLSQKDTVDGLNPFFRM